MFSGIVTSIGSIESSERQGDLLITVACDFNPDDIATGQSIAVSGTCLTVTSKGRLASGKSYFAAALSAETLARTAPRWEKTSHVNLERALKLGDSLDGHIVTGHVDGIATIKKITPSLPSPASGRGKEEGSHILDIEAPQAFSRFIAEKSSVTLDGVSLTVNRVEGSRFQVNIIPYTWQNTTLSERREGDALNLEVDTLARYVERLLQVK